MLGTVGISACVPEAAKVPLHAPDAVQVVAPMASQVSVTLLPDITVEFDDVKVTIGAVPMAAAVEPKAV